MLLLLSLISIAVPALGQMNFTGHKVFSATGKSWKETEHLKKLSEMESIDVWNLPGESLHQEMRFRVSPKMAKYIERDLKSKGIDFYVAIEDLQKYIDAEREDNPPDDALAGREEDFQLDVYHTYEAIMAHLDSLGSRYSGLAEVKEIGRSYEKNAIKGLKIGSSGNADKPAIWIDCGMHAREWVAPATCLYIMEQLLKGYDTDPEIQKLSDTYDWYIFPVMNPDGYKYTWSFNRMWRKNRSPSPARNPFCRGVDPNRNFDALFGGPGTSNNPCSEIYRGPSAFSEPESQAVRDGVNSLGENLKVYITIHSYSQLYMSPYGTSRDHSPDHDDLMSAMEAACNAIKETHGETYRFGTISNIIYPAAGSSTDWAYAGAKVKYSFAVELRDTGRQGFMLSRDQIIPTGEENFAGIRALVGYIESNP